MDRPQITFADAAGVEEAKWSFRRLSIFLKIKFKRLGGKIPKGVLLLGPPEPVKPFWHDVLPVKPGTVSFNEWIGFCRNVCGCRCFTG